MIRTGLDKLLERPRALAGRRYALLAHGASVTADLEPIHLALERVGAERPVFLLGPEHGFYGVEQDMVPSSAATDPWTGRSVMSLYGEDVASLKPASGVLDEVDLLVIDLQDVGSRYYTYAATAVWAAFAALDTGCEVWVLDRPNPLGGVEIEGNLRRQGFDSFVGAFRLPVRHGLTLAELLRLELSRAGKADGLTCWVMEGWSRDMSWSSVDRPWIAPSPNIPTFETALVYPGACLLEATTFSEGRGTTRPFELIGAPEIDAVELAARLNSDSSFLGSRFVPTFFKPQYQKHAGKTCGGVQWVVTDRDTFSPYRTGVRLVEAVWRLAERQTGWRQEPYEFVTDRPAIDLLTGDDKLRQALETGESPTEWLSTWQLDEENFRQERCDILLYPEPEVLPEGRGS